MKLTNYIQTKRFGLMLRTDIQGEIRPLGFATATALGLLILNTIVNLFQRDRGEYLDLHEVQFPLYFLLAGCLLASLSFFRLQSKERATMYLSIPASQLEKFLSRWIISLPVYVVLGLLTYLIADGISGILAGMSGIEWEHFQLFSKETWETLRVFILLHSLFMLGALFFKKYAPVTTPLSLLGIAVGFGFLTILIFRIVFWEFFEGWELRPPPATRPGEGLDNFARETGPILLKWIGFGALPVFFWITAYLKLTEKEV